MDRFERYMLQRYALRALEGRRSKVQRPSRALAGWIHEHAVALGVPEPNVDGDKLDGSPGRIDAETWTILKPIVERLAAGGRPPPATGLERRLNWLSELLTLQQADSAILGAATRVLLNKPMGSLVELLDPATGSEVVAAPTLALLTAQPTRLVRRALLATQPLRLLGLLEERGRRVVAPTDLVLRIAQAETTDPERLRGLLMGKSRRAELAWEDFQHLGEFASLTERLLRGALDERANGINVLFYGEPGTGKTEFVRTLAQRLGAGAIFAGELDEYDGEPDRGSRIAAFAIARALAGRAGRTLLVVDEADDVFTGVDEDDAKARVGSKVFMNRLVERTEAPTIWITNHPERLGPAVLRRMALAVRFPAPGRAARRRVVERIARRRKLALPPEALERLAEVEASPAVMDGALRVAKLTGGSAKDAALAARSVGQAMGRGSRLKPPRPLAFDPALSGADQDLEALATRIAAATEPALSFCFHGPSGTGKSAFARHLAERLGLDVVERRASDLLSMWVGESEKQIARAFEEAADRRALLIFDEADSLLRDRVDARAGWEVTQVNEMLTWMERHPYPFVCTTNRMETLDPASLRRFLFKVRFRAMDAEQACAAFVRTFGVEPPQGVARLDPLTPGDFALVARRARLLGETDPARLTAMLAEEVAAKPGGGRAAIGF